MTLLNHDSRSRDDTCVYYIPTFNGSVVCSRPNIVLGDFYRSGGADGCQTGTPGGGSTPPADQPTPQPKETK